MLHAFPSLPRLPVDPSWTFAIVRSVWYGDLTEALAESARAELVRYGVSRENIQIIDAPGAYEIPLLCQTAIERGASGVLAFGIVMQGDTDHAQHVTTSVAHALMDIQLQQRTPILFEVLHVRSIEDARARTQGPGAKGPYAAAAILHSLATMQKMRS